MYLLGARAVQVAVRARSQTQVRLVAPVDLVVLPFSARQGPVRNFVVFIAGDCQAL